MSEVKFSVLMTVYSKENPLFFKQSLDSIIKDQSLTPNEIVIVKDGPLTKELDDVIECYFKNYEGVFKIISLKKNMRQGYASNVGGSHCSYEYIARMDSDDIAFPDRFEKQIDYLTSNDVDILGGQLLEFYGENRNSVVSERRVPLNHNEIGKMMKYRMSVSNPTVMYRKEVFETIGGYDPKSFPEDYDFFVRAYLQGFKFGNLKENILWFRLGENKDKAIRRRHGYTYFKTEFKLYKKFYKIGFYNFFEFSKMILFKLPFRIIPFPLFKFLYYNVFRKI